MLSNSLRHMSSVQPFGPTLYTYSDDIFLFVGKPNIASKLVFEVWLSEILTSIEYLESLVSRDAMSAKHLVDIIQNPTYWSS